MTKTEEGDEACITEAEGALRLVIIGQMLDHELLIHMVLLQVAHDREIDQMGRHN